MLLCIMLQLLLLLLLSCVGVLGLNLLLLLACVALLLLLLLGFSLGLSHIWETSLHETSLKTFWLRLGCLLVRLWLR